MALFHFEGQNAFPEIPKNAVLVNIIRHDSHENEHSFWVSVCVYSEAKSLPKSGFVTIPNRNMSRKVAQYVSQGMEPSEAYAAYQDLCKGRFD